MVLSDIDRSLLQRCLSRQPQSWQSFVDRFLGLVIHVINHTAQSRSIQLTSHDREDLAAEVFVALVNDDFSVLRNFRGESSLATYLTVVARRVVVRELLKRKSPAALSAAAESTASEQPETEQRIADRDEVQRLIESLSDPEAQVVKMYHLEGRSYQEIGSRLGMPVNSIGPTLSRARAKMRQAGADLTGG